MMAATIPSWLRIATIAPVVFFLAFLPSTFGCSGINTVNLGATTPTATITSPGYNGVTIFNGNYNCTWNVMSPVGSTISLNCSVFIRSTCARNYYFSYAGKRICKGNVINYVTTGNSIQLRLVTVYIIRKSSGVGFSCLASYRPPVTTTTTQTTTTAPAPTTTTTPPPTTTTAPPQATTTAPPQATTTAPPQATTTTPANCICGKKLVDSNPSTPEYPWHVGIAFKLATNDYRLICSGSIIHNSWILTSAHCLDGKAPIDLRVYVGAQILNPNNITGTSTVAINVASTKIHEGYSSANFNNDIGLVQLAAPISGVSPVCLPYRYQGMSIDFSDLSGIINGWGKTSAAVNAPYSILSVSLTFLSNTTCSAAQNVLNIIPTSSMLCGGYVASNGCFGNSGGSIVYERSTYNFAIGIATLSTGSCIISNAATVFTKAASYLPWIENNTIGQNFEYC